MSTYAPSVQTVTITNGGTSQLLVAASNRRSLWIQPQTEACLIQFGATAGLQAAGTLTFGANAAADETIAINGVTWTAKASSPSTAQFLIGATKEDTATNLAAALNASANSSINIATYSASAAAVTITYTNGGTDGNAYTLADSSSGHITKSGATLSGGSNTVGGVYLALDDQFSETQADFASINSDVYVLSASNSAKVAYLEGL